MQILVAYRGTNVGKDLLDLAIRHAKAFEGKIHLVTSLPGGEKTIPTKDYRGRRKPCQRLAKY